MAKLLSLTEIIENSRLVHGDKYDYSLIKEGIRVKTEKLQIICPIHNVFPQWYGHHITGFGCPHCSGKAKKSTEIFIKEAKNIHGEKYDYSLVNYKYTPEIFFDGSIKEVFIASKETFKIIKENLLDKLG